MPKIFISYRREDSAYPAAAIRTRLASEFGNADIFFDVDSIPPGHDFRVHIGNKVGECDYVIVVIGRSWLTVCDEDGTRRLENAGDFVRLEIEAALKRKVPVIPVLVDNAGMPKADQLPDSLSELIYRNAHFVRPEPDLNTDLERLARRICEQEVERAKPLERARAPAAPRPRSEFRPQPEGGPSKARANRPSPTRPEGQRVAKSAQSDNLPSQITKARRSNGAAGSGRQLTARGILAVVAVAAVCLAVGLIWPRAIGKLRLQNAADQLDSARRDHELKLNEYLGDIAWSGNGVEIRVPKQFQPITPKTKEGEAHQERDPRQPVFADLELPGLQGAWQANFPLTGNEGNGVAWLYLCSNSEFLAKKGDEAKAMTFNSEVIQRIATAVGQQVQPIGKLPLYEVPPKTEEAFVDRRKYHVLSPGIPAIYNDKSYRVRIFAYKKEKSPAQISLIYMLPDNIVQASVLDRAIDLSLETLSLSRTNPYGR
jgi:hypothetical protein